jgi:hypothetical protein
MKGKIFILLYTLIFMMSGCTGVQVSQDYDAGMISTDYRTYDWISRKVRDSADVRTNDPLLHKRFDQAINRVLMEKGYVRSDDPDFRVGYDFSITSRIESDPFTSSFGLGLGSRYRYGGIGLYGSDIRQYDLGILVIDIYAVEPDTKPDTKSDTLVWRGRGSERISTHSTPEHLSALVNRMVEAILAQFPPQ